MKNSEWIEDHCDLEETESAKCPHCKQEYQASEVVRACSMCGHEPTGLDEDTGYCSECKDHTEYEDTCPHCGDAL